MQQRERADRTPQSQRYADAMGVHVSVHAPARRGIDALGHRSTVDALR